MWSFNYVNDNDKISDVECFFFFFSICGILHSVDQYLNIKLTDITVMEQEKYPHMVFIDISITHK